MNCTAAAELSDYAKQAAYKTVCGIQPDGDHMGQPFDNLTPYRDALKTVDCSCINYKHSTFLQPNLVGRDYTRFIQDFPQLDLPSEAYCWWPTCTDHSRSLTVTSQAGPTDSTAVDPKCPALAFSMHRISVGLPPEINDDEPDPTLPIDPGHGGSHSPSSKHKSPGSVTPFTPGPATSPATSPRAAPKPKSLYTQTWFIAVMVVVGVLIVGGVLYTLMAQKPSKAVKVVKRPPPPAITTRPQ
jgi:hypothetical protein